MAAYQDSFWEEYLLAFIVTLSSALGSKAWDGEYEESL